jgi:hypothetical protein
MRTPHEVDDEVVRAKVAAVGAVDVLACHIPPDVPGLLYDVQARRFERGSAAVLDAIRDTSPELVLFGHVHQPLQARTRIGRTECVNVGHFRATGRPWSWSTSLPGHGRRRELHHHDRRRARSGARGDRRHRPLPAVGRADQERPGRRERR